MFYYLSKASYTICTKFNKKLSIYNIFGYSFHLLPPLTGGGPAHASVRTWLYEIFRTRITFDSLYAAPCVHFAVAFAVEFGSVWFDATRSQVHNSPSVYGALVMQLQNCLSTFISDFVGCQNRSKYAREKCVCEGTATFVRSSRMLVDPIAGQE